MTPVSKDATHILIVVGLLLCRKISIYIYIYNQSSFAVLNIKGSLQMYLKKYNPSDDDIKTQDTK